MAPLKRINARATHRVITLSELKELGCTSDAVRHLVRAERLWHAYPSVYALEGGLTPQGWAFAAARACRGATSRLTAAAVLGYRAHWPDPPSVTIVGRFGSTGPSAIDVHHARHLETGVCDGIPVTSPAQTISDCARLLDADDLKRLLRAAEYDGLDLMTLHRPGIPKPLRDALDRYVIGSGLTESELEARFYELCAAAGLPLPEIQARFPDQRRVDFVWHNIRLIVETDGRRGHRGAIAQQEDRARDRARLLDGYNTMRFTWFEVVFESTLVSEQLMRAHATLRS